MLNALYTYFVLLEVTSTVSWFTVYAFRVWSWYKCYWV